MLVNNAGVMDQQNRLDEMSTERIRRILDINTFGSILCAREAVKRMSTKHGGAGGSLLLYGADPDDQRGEVVVAGAAAGGLAHQALLVTELVFQQQRVFPLKTGVAHLRFAFLNVMVWKVKDSARRLGTGHLRLLAPAIDQQRAAKRNHQHAVLVVTLGAHRDHADVRPRA